MTRLRAKFDGKVIVPEGPVDLPKDRLLDVSIDVAEDEGPTGDPASVRAAMNRGTVVSDDDVAELQRSIAAGRVPAKPGGVFD